MAIKKNMGVLTQCCLLTIICCIVLLCGCGQDPVPEPPLEKNRLLIDAMNKMKKQSHGLALARLDKLKVIYPNNPNLLALRETEYDNIFIQKIQSGLDNGNVDTALLIIDRAEKSKPLSETLLNIKSELVALRTLNRALLAIAKSSSSDELNDAIKQARELIKGYPVAQSYLPLLVKYEKFAKQMAVNEHKNAKLDLASDFEIEKKRSKTDQQLVKVLAAQVEVENTKK